MAEMDAGTLSRAGPLRNLIAISKIRPDCFSASGLILWDSVPQLTAYSF